MQIILHIWIGFLVLGLFKNVQYVAICAFFLHIFCLITRFCNWFFANFPFYCGLSKYSPRAFQKLINCKDLHHNKKIKRVNSPPPQAASQLKCLSGNVWLQISRTQSQKTEKVSILFWFFERQIANTLCIF